MDVEMYPNPRFGEEKSIYLADPLVAKMPEVHGAVVTFALERAAEAELKLLSHRDTGNSYIDVEERYPDALVSLVDPRAASGNGGAAMGIERETDILSSTFPGVNPIPDLLRDEDVGSTFLERD